ncbi:heavy metal translocating P-type ATPase [Sediminicoccus rosea]|uniref:Copper-translocating P-type ATPase n=1 Tax=Sediminicoccus rosea TaxID=1225128 RepID=A0ABZ0PJ74_9PROT|nr:copper-translocating P-type ATPase [Sediminicoccus rosea]WPB85774.1 copper-translocating P-type ATPase [Sediminicoccus rosea]
MSHIGRPVCAHCGAPSVTRFCCTGCEGAHALVQGLGLDAFYRRREGAEGQLKPLDPPSADFTGLAHPNRDGTQTLELMVAGLTCGACIWLVEQALAAEPGVTRARANLSTRRLSVTWRGEAARGNDLAALVARLGFRVAPFSPACLRASEDAEGRELTRALGIASFGAMNVMLVSVAVWAGSDMGPDTRHMMHWLAALIGMPTIAYAGMPLFRSAWRGLRAGRLNMDCAVSLGILATTAMSLSETMRNGDFTWFDGATTLLALMLAGRVLDRAARRRARQSAAELLALQEGSVTVLGEANAAPMAVPMERVPVGARILVASGERLRLDAVLEDASALLDTAATTGESLPRPFAQGEALAAGGVNMGAPFVARVTAAAGDGSLAAMGRMLERAEQARGRYTSLADRAARIYVPIAHVVALCTFLGWWLLAGASWQAALVPAVAALIITCPCGLAIAVPAVQVVASGALFRRGVLLSSPTGLERLASADHVVLDKTGTLTEGRPRLLPGGWGEDDLQLAASLAATSRHPLSRALSRACPDAAPASGVVEVPGAGLVQGETRLGSAAFLGLAEDAGMALHLVRPGRAPVTFRFEDALRPDAAAAVQAFQRAGLGVELLSGDAPEVVERLAREAGITLFTARATPEAKAARITALAAQGRRVLMVGDGINDAAALAAAHVSAAPAEGTDLAQAASDFVLMGGGLLPLAEAVGRARRAQSAARQNIAFAFTYNIIAVPVAVAGFATPLIAALVMASSSLAVIGNALRVGR